MTQQHLSEMSPRRPEASLALTGSVLSRRTWLAGIAALVLAPMPTLALAATPSIQVWKDPNCGCCKGWIAHLEKSGFSPTVIEEGNSAARARLGMPEKFGSCHTSLIQGYVIEGHVPAADIQRLLKERPKALGIAAPGMPIGSPGMDGPAYGGRQNGYQVLLIQRDGSSSVFNTYPKG